jgi:heat shock protein HslJ
VILLAGLLPVQPGCKTSETGTEEPFPVDITWLLETIHNSDINIINIVDTFSITFRSDFTASMVVDCNTCFGFYELLGADSIDFSSTTECTEAYCGPDSHDRDFHSALIRVTRWERNGSRFRLYFTTADGEGYMEFKQG